MKRCAVRGFTLIELVVIIMILSIVGVSLVRMFGEIAGTVNTSHDINAAAQLAQECGEYLLSVRRLSGYATASTTDCSTLPTFNGNARPTVTINTAYAGTDCPAAGVCSLISVNASYNSGSAQLAFVIVNY